MWVYGAAADAAVRYDRPDYSGRVILVLGSEGRGLRPRVAEACDELIHLPNRGQVGSLNVVDRRGGARVRNLAFSRGNP